MKAHSEHIGITGYEIDDLTQYPLSKELDKHFAGVLSDEIEIYQHHIGESLGWSMRDWIEAPLDYEAEDSVPKQTRDFNRLIRSGKRLKAREASLILKYVGEEGDEERSTLEHRIPTDFAQEIAVLSMLHSIVHKNIAATVRIADRRVHEEVSALTTREDARQAWIASLRTNHPNSLITRAYWNELKRKEHMEIAQESHDNVYMLGEAYGFTIGDAMLRHFDKLSKQQ